MTGRLLETIGYVVLALAVIGLAGYFAWPRQPQEHAGATPDWSPKADVEHAAEGLTPFELLPTEPAYYKLRNGHTIEGQPLPSWEALETDTHRVLEPTWEAMLAGFRQRMDAHAAAIATTPPVQWHSGEVTLQWNAKDLREAVKA